MWREMSTPMTCLTSKHCRQIIQNSTYSAIRVILGNLGRPGCGAITTIEHTLNRSDWWEEESSVEDYAAYSMLSFKSIRLVLQAGQSIDWA